MSSADLLSPEANLLAGLRRSGVNRFFERMLRDYGDICLKDLTIDEVGPNREMRVGEHRLVNFGFDSFLGLDQDERVKRAVARGAQAWGTQFGASRIFASPQLERDVERKIAKWMGAEAACIFPSVTLANVGILPGMLGKRDVLVLDQFAHNSMQEAAKIAASNGVRVLTTPHDCPLALAETLHRAQPFRSGLIAIDGVYSMSGVVASIPALNQVAREFNCMLYVDDAHATAVMGEFGRGTVLEAQGSYDNTITVGCLSKASSVFGAFAVGSAELVKMIRMNSNSYIFGGPVPPPYLEAISTIVDILQSEEYPQLQSQLRENIACVVNGLRAHDFVVFGGTTPIVTVLIGEESQAFECGKAVFDDGSFVQSVTFPAVPRKHAVIRIQINANHRWQDLEKLVSSMARLRDRFELPRASALVSGVAA